MELTRREAVAALAAAGLTVGGGATVRPYDRDLRALLALAEVLYPSEVEVTEEFVETYAIGRMEDDWSYYETVRESIDALDDRAEDRFDEAFADLSVEQRDQLLRALGLDGTDPDPDGTEVERMRYYLVNDLLFALFATPVGGQLVGAENPTGFPGGLVAYQRGPRT